MLLMTGGATFDCGSYSTPSVVDWNNDGKKDLLCGEYYGRVHLLVNVGTDRQPVFNASEFLLDGTDVLSAGNNSDPAPCDWNRDGRKDLLVGNSNGTVLYFVNRGTDADPVFDGFVPLEAGGAVLGVESSSSIDVPDWDNDGVRDVLCGYQDVYSFPRAGVNYYHALGSLSVDANTLSASFGGRVSFRRSRRYAAL